MRIAIEICVVILTIAASATAVESPSTQPAAPITTQPAVTTIRGRVNAPTGWDLQKPDLTHAVVYLGGDPALQAAVPALKRATMGQRDKAFVPSFMVVARGTDVEFPNWDHISHNVFSRSKAAPAFDLDRYPYGWSKTRNFDKVGVIQVFCNIHQQMHAVIVVTPNTFFAQCDAEGRFEIRGVPQGRHELVVWHERCGEQRRTLDVVDSSSELAFTLQENRGSIIANETTAQHSGYGVERGLGVKRERLDLPVVKDAHPAP